ncbi:MAG: hypothetical protein IJL38_01830 [Bacteroidales bacterium]|nr:hypothetical protein [Bacteroidales bacterium]
MKKTGLWIAGIVAVIALAVGIIVPVVTKGKSDGREAKIAEQVWQLSQKRPEGFTVDISTMEEPAEGIAVAYEATQGSLSQEALTTVVTHALEHDGYVGGWLDEESGLYYFDSTKLFPEDKIEEALEFARENGQTAIYIISTGEEIRVEAARAAA